MIARLAYPALLTLGVLAIYWKFTLSNQFSWFDGPDHVNQVIPWLEMQAREWHAGRLPILDPHQWAGTALLAQNQPGTLHPINWILFSLPLKYGRLQIPILNGYFVLMHLIGAWCMFALARAQRISRPSSVVVALGYGCGGFMAAVQWPQMLNGVGYLPLVLLCWLRYLRQPGQYLFAATAGALTGLISLAGHHSAPELTLVLVTVVTAYRLFTRWSLPRAGRVGAGLLVYGLFFALIGAVLALPAIEFWRESLRWVGTKAPVSWNDAVPYAAHRQYSLGAASLPGFVISGFYADGPQNPFLGVTFFALAIQGYLARRGAFANLLLC
ncbi:MAG: hypothetical protein FJW30_27110, partial [Acidobacteria bacterium]|nr:hypothetical protein [Acidobacteriota bacterium]